MCKNGGSLGLWLNWRAQGTSQLPEVSKYHAQFNPVLGQDIQDGYHFFTVFHWNWWLGRQLWMVGDQNCKTLRRAKYFLDWSPENPVLYSNKSIKLHYLFELLLIVVSNRSVNQCGIKCVILWQAKSYQCFCQKLLLQEQKPDKVCSCLCFNFHLLLSYTVMSQSQLGPVKLQSCCTRRIAWESGMKYQLKNRDVSKVSRAGSKEIKALKS